MIFVFLIYTQAFDEHLDTIKWHAERDIPGEVNEPPHWDFRMAPDHLVVADAYLFAYIAIKMGVKTYIEYFKSNS